MQTAHTSPSRPVLTLDNFALSEPTPSFSVADFVRAAHADNTLRAYQADISHFTAWGGNIPASPDTVAQYLAAHATTHAVTTLARWLVTIGKAHQVAGYDSPTDSELVRLTLRGIRRTLSRPQAQARPVLADEMRQIVESMGHDLRSMRDRALLLLGYAGAFRRSELVSLTVEDVQHAAEGLLIRLRRSKTDQMAQGRVIAIPYAGNPNLCPVRGLTVWLAKGRITEGALFRPINRHGQLSRNALSAEAVAIILKERAIAAGLDATGYSGHSLRAGLATSAAQAGVTALKIRQQTGHTSDAMLARYIRHADLFADNACAGLL